MSHHSKATNNIGFRTRPAQSSNTRSTKRLSASKGQADPHKPIVLHLFDDTTPARGRRIISHFLNAPSMREHAIHRAAQLTRNPWNVNTQGADLIVSHLTVGWRNLPFRRRLRTENPDRILIQVEHVHSKGFETQNVFNQSRFDTMLRSGYDLVDHVVTLSEAQRDWILSRALTPSSRVSAIPSAVGLAQFAALPASNRPARTFGLIGPLRQRTGFEIAIRASGTHSFRRQEPVCAFKSLETALSARAL